MTDFSAAAQQWASQSGLNPDAASDKKDYTTYWSPKSGEAVIRILPPGQQGCAVFQRGNWGILNFRYEVWPNNAAFTNFTGDKPLIANCANRIFPQEFMSDPIKQAQLENDEYLPAELGTSRASQFYPKKKVLVNAFVKQIMDDRRNNIDADMCNKPVVASMPAGFWAFLTDPTNMPHFNPMCGLDVKITRTGKGLQTAYSYAFLPGVAASPILQTEEATFGLLASVQDLATIVRGEIARSKSA